VGFDGQTVNTLCLFSAAGSREFDMSLFNSGDDMNAVPQKFEAETVSKVLHPSDDMVQGKELRLIQEHFLVACSIRDIVRQHEGSGKSINDLHEFAAMQFNDVHPALSVAELTGFHVDERDFEWNDAWHVTQKSLA